MHAKLMITRVLGPCLEGLHRKRFEALMRVATGLLWGGVCSLSGIALRLGGPIRYKHRLKCVDRLLGCTGLHRWRDALYQQVASVWLKDLAQFLVVVDWTDLRENQRWQCLRASVVVEGRSVTLYEQVHAQKQLGNPVVHREFLRRLATILPAGSRPIVMTDAGFHSPWFQAVTKRGWEFIGRVRGCNRLSLGETQDWIAVRDLYACASTRACDLGLGAYARSNPTSVRVVLAARQNKGRHCLNMYGKKRVGRASAKAARSAREPWVLVCSPSLVHLQPEAIVSLYAQRMGIEQSFRDTKNLRWGLGLEVSRSRSRARLEMLLLIAHLVSLAQRLIGECAKRHQQELQFMATRRTDRAEISVLTLARRMLNQGVCNFNSLLPWQAIPPLRAQAAAACARAG